MDNVENVRQTLKGYRVTQLKELCREVGISQCAKNKKVLIDRLLPIVLKSAGYEVVSIEKEVEEKPKRKTKIKKVPVKKVEEEKKEEEKKISLDEKNNNSSVSIEMEESVEIQEDSGDDSSVTEVEEK